MVVSYEPATVVPVSATVAFAQFIVLRVRPLASALVEIAVDESTEMTTLLMADASNCNKVTLKNCAITFTRDSASVSAIEVQLFMRKA